MKDRPLNTYFILSERRFGSDSRVGHNAYGVLWGLVNGAALVVGRAPVDRDKLGALGLDGGHSDVHVHAVDHPRKIVEWSAQNPPHS